MLQQPGDPGSELERLLADLGGQLKRTLVAGIAALLLMAGCSVVSVLSILGIGAVRPPAAAAAGAGDTRTVAAAPEFYTAAFAELRAEAVPGSGPATLALNVRRSAAVAAEAALRGADILVLPEYGLSGFGRGRDAWIPFLEQLPEPGGVPCDAPPEDYALAPSLVGLSCAAREHGIALVANLGDLIYCDASEPPPPGCATSRDGRLQYNTAVAFDTDGTYLARAWKQNLWGEASYFDEPVACGLSSFVTSFGVRFGLFTCADLIYEWPAEALILQEEGISNFVAPMAWSDEMAQMQALPTFQAWSYRHCVNFVAANHRGPAMSGSGVFSCGRVVTASFDPGTGDAPLQLATLPSRPGPGPAQAAGRLGLLGPKELAVSTSSTTTANTSSGSTTRSGEDGAATAWVFEPVDPEGEGWQSLCSASGEVCCTLLSLIGAGPAVGRGYVLAALDGDDEGGGISWSGAACAGACVLAFFMRPICFRECSGGLSSCLVRILTKSYSLAGAARAHAVLACNEPGPGCLEYQPPPTVPEEQLSGVIIAMTTRPSIGPNISIFPMALAEATAAAAGAAARPHGNASRAAAPVGEATPASGRPVRRAMQQRLLEPYGPTAELEFQVLTGAPGFGFWRLQAAALPVGTSSPLVSALLYGRVFGRDELSYSCPLELDI
eukprot:SAG22_NODE_331_length_12174_cov_12.920497_7_plen_667_part_00